MQFAYLIKLYFPFPLNFSLRLVEGSGIQWPGRINHSNAKACSYKTIFWKVKWENPLEFCPFLLIAKSAHSSVGSDLIIDFVRRC